MTEIDLTEGDPLELDNLMSGKGGTTRKSAGTARPKAAPRTTGKPTDSEREDKSLEAQILEQLKDLAEGVMASDPQLADILERRGEQMAHAFVSLTRMIPFLRTPLLLIVNFLQPFFAFWEVLRHLFGKWSYRRAVRRAQREAEARGVVTVPADEAGAWRADGGNT